MSVLRFIAAPSLAGLVLQDVVRFTTVAQLLGASPAWWGFAGQQKRNKLQSLIDCLVRLCYLLEARPILEELCQTVDENLFTTALTNPGHVLNPLLPSVKTLPYSLHPRKHEQIVQQADNLMRKIFLTRMLYNLLSWKPMDEYRKYLLTYLTRSWIDKRILG